LSGVYFSGALEEVLLVCAVRLPSTAIYGEHPDRLGRDLSSSYIISPGKHTHLNPDTRGGRKKGRGAVVSLLV